MQRGQRHLRGADQVEVVVGQPVDLLLGVGQHAGPVQRLLAHQHRRDHRLEALGQRASRARSARAPARAARAARAGRQSASPTAARRAPCRSSRRPARGGRARSRPASPTSRSTVSCVRGVGGRQVGQRGQLGVALRAHRRLLVAERAAARGQRRQLGALLLAWARPCSARLAWFCSARSSSSSVVSARQRSSSSSTRSIAAAALRRRGGPAPRARRRGRDGSA